MNIIVISFITIITTLVGFLFFYETEESISTLYVQSIKEGISKKSVPDIFKSIEKQITFQNEIILGKEETSTNALPLSDKKLIEITSKNQYINDQPAFQKPTIVDKQEASTISSSLYDEKLVEDSTVNEYSESSGGFFESIVVVKNNQIENIQDKEKASQFDKNTNIPPSNGSIPIKPSFDCSKENTFIEQTICSNQNLAVFDNKMTALYKNILLNSGSFEKLKEEQRNWLKNNRNSCLDAQCLEREYINRIDALNHSYKFGEINKVETIESDADMDSDLFSKNELDAKNKKNQVNVVVRSIETANYEDGFSFKTTNGKEYYVYSVDDRITGIEYIAESEEKRTPICLTLAGQDIEGDIGTISKGYCSTASKEINPGWYVSVANPSLVIRSSSGIQGKKIGNIPMGEKVRVISVTNHEDVVNGMSSKWVKVEWVNISGYIFGGFLVTDDNQKLTTIKSTDNQKHINCTDLNYGNDNYHKKMQELVITSQLSDGYYSRDHEYLVKSLCSGETDEADILIDNGNIEAKEVTAIAKTLQISYEVKRRSEAGKTYGDSKEKFLGMGLCNACSANVAYYYTEEPLSECGKLAKKAIRGDPDAILSLQNNPEYCI